MRSSEEGMSHTQTCKGWAGNSPTAEDLYEPRVLKSSRYLMNLTSEQLETREILQEPPIILTAFWVWVEIGAGLTPAGYTPGGGNWAHQPTS
jgi:hypothetical protein